ncbi:hypothetical protein R1flu_013307 [Riccia fluitans]|uniref:Uncharacterized protein n=1 Tax=Riccia fluitans TaxID=41844 RepID=A0ABD1YD01_9MARC
MLERKHRYNCDGQRLREACHGVSSHRSQGFAQTDESSTVTETGQTFARKASKKVDPRTNRVKSECSCGLLKK